MTENDQHDQDAATVEDQVTQPNPYAGPYGYVDKFQDPEAPSADEQDAAGELAKAGLEPEAEGSDPSDAVPTPAEAADGEQLKPEDAAAIAEAPGPVERDAQISDAFNAAGLSPEDQAKARELLEDGDQLDHAHDDQLEQPATAGDQLDQEAGDQLDAGDGRPAGSSA